MFFPLKKSLVAATVILMAASFNAVAAGKSVYIILSNESEPFKQALDGFKETVNRSVSGVNFVQDSLKVTDAGAIVSKIAPDKQALIYTAGTESTKLAKEKLTDSQIVFGMVFNSNEFSGSNTSGVSLDIPISMKFSAIKDIMPHVKTIGVIYSAASDADFQEASSKAGDYGIKVIGKKIESDSEFASALQGLEGQMDCFLMVVDAKVFFSQTIKLLFLESQKNKFPVIGLSSFYTKAGATISFDCDYKDMGRQTGEIMVRVLNGEKASAIKTQRPRKVTYSINLPMAEKIGVKIPPQAVKDAAETF